MIPFHRLQVFQDVGEQFLIEPDLITRERFLGKGAFGAVYAGTIIHKVSICSFKFQDLFSQLK